MALITKENIEKIDKERNSVHGKVRASYTYFQNGGKTIFQIDTYGSTTREQKDKISRHLRASRSFFTSSLSNMPSSHHVAAGRPCLFNNSKQPLDVISVQNYMKFYCGASADY